MAGTPCGLLYDSNNSSRSPLPLDGMNATPLLLRDAHFSCTFVATLAGARDANPLPEQTESEISSVLSSNSFLLPPSDIFYPQVFKGSWLCDSVLEGVEIVDGREERVDEAAVRQAKKNIGSLLTYNAR